MRGKGGTVAGRGKKAARRNGSCKLRTGELTKYTVNTNKEKKRRERERERES